MSTEWEKAFTGKRLNSPLTQQLQKELQSFEIRYFYYTSFFSGSMYAGIASRKRSNDFSFEAISSRIMEKMHYVATPDSKFLKFIARYFHSYGDSDEMMDRPYTNGIMMVRGGRNQKIESAASSLEVQSSAYYDTQSNKQGVAGSFALHSPLPTQEFESVLFARRAELFGVLERYHQAFMEAYPLELNPWLNLGIISSGAQKALQLLAQGLTIDEVACKLFMSKRGVDYHLEQLKVILEAENRSHLIAKACASGVIDLEPLRAKHRQESANPDQTLSHNSQ